VQEFSSSEKLDDRKITSLGSDLSKVQSQVDLSMCSIQALQQEQIVLVKVVHGGVLRSSLEGGIISSSLIHSGPIHLHRILLFKASLVHSGLAAGTTCILSSVSVHLLNNKSLTWATLSQIMEWLQILQK
jgi:hypothetical protein